jgi:hypothetical protein
LDTHITPRDYSVKPRGGLVKKRNSLMSMLSVALVVVLVAVIVPILQNNTKHNAEDGIDTHYTELTLLRPKLEEEYLASKAGNWYEDPDWTIKINALVAMIHKYREDFPQEEERLALHDDMLQELLKPAEITEQGQFNEWAVASAKEEVIDILSHSLLRGEADTVGLRVKLVNKTKDTVNQVQIAFEAFGADGGAANDTVRVDLEGNPTNQGFIRTNDYLLPGAEKEYIFPEVWRNPGVADAKVLWVNVTFTNEDSYYFPPEVCAEIWR